MMNIIDTINNFNPLYLSLITPLLGLIGFIYRRLIFLEWDVQYIAFGVILGIIPLLNIMLALVSLILIFKDIKDTPKALKLSKEERIEFQKERTESSGLDYSGW